VEFCDLYMNLGPKIFSKMTSLGVILCEESIACIPEEQKRLPNSDSGGKYEK
jgi:hypothetical protein